MEHTSAEMNYEANSIMLFPIDFRNYKKKYLKTKENMTMTTSVQGQEK